MTVFTVAVTYGRTINTGNYSSLKLECTINATVDEDDPAVALERAWDMARAEVKAQWTRFAARKGEEA